jgi:uncharacterized protein involved in outer membrane biogenesis
MLGGTRSRYVWAGAAAGIAVLLVAALIALPEIVRRVAVDRLARMTGRAVALDDVDLNLFTGRLALKGFRLAQRGSSDPALSLPRVDTRVAVTSLLSRHVVVRELLVASPTIHVRRVGPTEFDFSDLLALVRPPDPNAPSTRAITLERLTITDGTIVARDEAVAEPATWRIVGLQVDGAGLTTRRDAPPGRLAVRLALNGTPVRLEADSIELAAARMTARVAVDGFELAQVRGYVPDAVPALAVGGRLTLDLTAGAARGGDGAVRLVVKGAVRAEDLALARRGARDAFVRLPTVAVDIREAALPDRSVALARVDVEGLDLRGRRDGAGIDLLTLLTPPAAPPPAPAATPADAPPAISLAVDELRVRRGRLTFVDESVTPAATLVADDLSLTVRQLAYPGRTPLAFDVAVALPGAGRFRANGTATVTPPAAEVTTSMRGASIAPYRSYFPAPVRAGGTFNADSRSTVRLVDGRLVVRSQGRSWIDGLQFAEPAATDPAIRVERIALEGVDFQWPAPTRVARITVRRPEVRIERAADGTMNLKGLFAGSRPTGPQTTTAAPASEPAAGVRTAARRPTPPVAVDIGSLAIEEGDVRFLDRSVKPAFSQTLSHLAVGIEGLSTTPDRRARLTAQAIVGGDAALDVRGEFAPLGETYADLTIELRDFALASLNPYTDSVIAWIVQRGKLAARAHYRIEHNELTATNEIAVERLGVTPSRAGDEVQRRVGVPLGLIVALVTDSQNSIKVDIPMSGPLDQWRVGLADAVWTAVKNAVVNILASPFRAIGRLFTRRDNTIEGFRVEPVVFPPGSETLTAEMQRHLASVADFLRRSPLVNLAVTAVTSPRDADTVKDQELTARLQARQRAGGLPTFAAAVAAAFTERFPDVRPAPPSERQLEMLREKEPPSPERLAALSARRIAVVRETLAQAEGIPARRLPDGTGGAAAPPGEGRVEFAIVPGGEP